MGRGSPQSLGLMGGGGVIAPPDIFVLPGKQFLAACYAFFV